MQPAARCDAMSGRETLRGDGAVRDQVRDPGQTSTVSSGTRALSEYGENAERPTGVGPSDAATPLAAALTAPALASDTSSACVTSSGSDAQEPPTELQRLQLQKLHSVCEQRGIPCIPSVVSRCDFMRTAQESAAAPAAVPPTSSSKSHPQPTHPMPSRPPPR